MQSAVLTTMCFAAAAMHGVAAGVYFAKDKRTEAVISYAGAGVMFLSGVLGTAFHLLVLVPRKKAEG